MLSLSSLSLLSLYALLGVGGGVLSTVTGMGGGIALVALLSVIVGPHEALAMTAPALLLGNAHRCFVFRDALDRRITSAFVIGSIPGAALGAYFVGDLPPRALTVGLVLVTLFALARSRGLFSLEPPAWSWTPFAFVAGLVAAGSGAGVIVAPALVAGGLSGRALIATGAAIALSMHLGRVAGYGVSGLYEGAELLSSLALAVGLITGNTLGVRVRDRLGKKGTDVATERTLIASLGLAIASLFR